MKRLLGLLTILSVMVMLIAGCGGNTNKTLYTLKLNVQGEGSINNVKSINAQYEKGTVIQFTVTPDTGSMFDHWSGLNGSQVVSNKVMMDGNKEITAVFIKNKYPLTVTYSGQGTVVQEVVQARSVTDYEHGVTVKLTPQPEMGWKFDHWEGDLIGSVHPTTITVDSAKNVVAVFVPANNYMGINVGTRLTYRVTGDPDVNEYSQETLYFVTTPSAKQAFKLQYDVNGAFNRNEYIVKEGSDYFLVGFSNASGGVEWRTPELRMTEPLTVGDSFDVGTVVSQETITVPAGTFKALKVVYSSGENSQETWFVPYVGIVKVIGHSQTDGTPVVITLELVSYSIQ